MRRTYRFYSWELAQCYIMNDYSKLGTYTKKCCIHPGDHLLSCLSTNNIGWVDSFVRIGDHLFCDDIVGYNKFIRINIPGM